MQYFQVGKMLLGSVSLDTLHCQCQLMFMYEVMSMCPSRKPKVISQKVRFRGSRDQQWNVMSRACCACPNQLKNLEQMVKHQCKLNSMIKFLSL